MGKFIFIATAAFLLASTSVLASEIPYSNLIMSESDFLNTISGSINNPVEIKLAKSSTSHESASDSIADEINTKMNLVIEAAKKSVLNLPTPNSNPSRRVGRRNANSKRRMN